MIRSLTVAVYPVVSVVAYGVLGALVRWDVPIIGPSADALLAGLKATVLPFQQGYFFLAGLSLVILVGIIALESIRPRFWCRYLCPLGALLSLIGRYIFPETKTTGPLPGVRAVPGGLRHRRLFTGRRFP